MFVNLEQRTSDFQIIVFKFYFPLLGTLFSTMFAITPLFSYFAIQLQQSRIRKILKSTQLTNQSILNFIFSFINTANILYYIIVTAISGNIFPIYAMILTFVTNLINSSYGDFVFGLSQSMGCLKTSLKKFKKVGIVSRKVNTLCRRHMEILELYAELNDIFYVIYFCSTFFFVICNGIYFIHGD